ncbi:MAG: glycosyltransferase [Bdellovibrionales bacterium]|jgi:glycosyltransferase involved in cell wall biosynthesis|nr:glycosyltransferase [Bdellovibrionales bacterium]MBT3525444.1 glycosyltransferase [Bdellovibrionales bacterium]MBT7669805.1 glycosyltransferase [Bdellovibrionales bacterium]MBT7766884.1 glycosyltransferase [Bdellovibrionales bacterium]
MSSPITVSVIIPTYNRATQVVPAIESVLSQSYRNFELIIVDDGSTDSTSKITMPILNRSDQPTRLLVTNNQGVSAARNFGVKHSIGKWIAFLDSDDQWQPNKLSLQIEYLANHPDCQLVHGEELWIRNGKRVNQRLKHKKSGGDIFIPSLKLCLISPSAVMLSRELYDQMGGFDDSYPVCEDYDLWLKITSLYQVGFVDTPITIKYGGHQDQLSHRYFAMDYWRIKSMDHLLTIRELNQNRRSAIYQQIVQKGEVLINGYKKHHNYQNLAEVEQIVNRAAVNLTKNV